MNTPRNLLLLLALTLLVGCNKKNGMSLAGTESNPLIVGAGQSNIERMNMATLIAPPLAAITVNLGKGNTSLAQWCKGGELYSSLITKIKARGTPAYLIWYQGEWEGMNGTGANDWAQRFTQFVRDVRTDLNAPELKFIFFRINSNNQYGAAWDEVREQQSRVSIPGVTMVSSDGCDLGIDELHYSDPGYKCLADRAVEAIKGN